jgi:hypothetical protein
VEATVSSAVLVFTNKPSVMQEDLSYQSAVLLFSLVLEGYTSRELGNFVQFALTALDCIYHYSGAL